MVQLKLNKLKMVDIAVVAVVLLIIAVFGAYYLNKPMTEAKKLNVTVEITDPTQVGIVAVEAAKDKTVYLNSTDIPVNVLSVTKGNNVLDILLQGPGKTDAGGFYIFNGQRILIGQKAEIHASYFAQGKITAVENAN